MGHAIIYIKALIQISLYDGSGVLLILPDIKSRRLNMRGMAMSKRTREIDKQNQSHGYGWASDAVASNLSEEMFLQDILGKSIMPEDILRTNTASKHIQALGETCNHDRYQPSSRPAPSPFTCNIKKRRRLLPDETSCLIEAFEKSPKPSQEVRDELASKLRMSQRAIQIWFQNRRAKVRRDAADSKASLSFAPVAREACAVGPAIRKIEPAPSREECARFEELFEMPDLDDMGKYSEPPMMVTGSLHSTESSFSSSGQASTPLTWDEPDWASPSSDWARYDFASEDHPKKETVGMDATLSWIDEFLQI